MSFRTVLLSTTHYREHVRFRLRNNNNNNITTVVDEITVIARVAVEKRFWNPLYLSAYYVVVALGENGNILQRYHVVSRRAVLYPCPRGMFRISHTAAVFVGSFNWVLFCEPCTTSQINILTSVRQIINAFTVRLCNVLYCNIVTISVLYFVGRTFPIFRVNE